MGETWRDPDPGDRLNLVDHRVTLEAIEREWLTDLFSSLGRERADTDALLARMRERRRIGLRKALPPVALRKGGRVTSA